MYDMFFESEEVFKEFWYMLNQYVFDGSLGHMSNALLSIDLLHGDGTCGLKFNSAKRLMYLF